MTGFSCRARRRRWPQMGLTGLETGLGGVRDRWFVLREANNWRIYGGHGSHGGHGGEGKGGDRAEAAAAQPIHLFLPAGDQVT